MKKNQSKDSALALANAIIKGIQEKKGKEIVCLDLRKINSTICDYFIICHGDSHRQVEAISDSVIETVIKQTGEKPWHMEGLQNSEWVLMDFVNVVSHVFLKDTRDFYNLEGLWADAEIIQVSETGSLIIKKEKKTPPKSRFKKKSPAVKKNASRKKKSGKNQLIVH